MNHKKKDIEAAEEYAIANYGVKYAYTSFLAGCEHKQKDVDELVEALFHLTAAQNGPPLIREQEYWQESYNKANELIEKYKR